MPSVTVNLSMDLLEKIDELSDKSGKSRSRVVEELVRKGLEAER